jgi:very-short-patch-repair endonuclease
LWGHLRDRRLQGIKFRRQAPLGPYIADFYNSNFRLVIEIDGEIHLLHISEDVERTEQLQVKGYRVIRFSNQQVMENIETVLNIILAACSKDQEVKKVTPSPNLGEGAGG